MMLQLTFRLPNLVLGHKLAFRTDSFEDVVFRVSFNMEFKRTKFEAVPIALGR